MQFNVLGPLEVLDSAGPRTIRRGRPRELLHLLLLHRRVVVPVGTVADSLWDEEQPLDATNSVYQVVSYLRRALGTEGRERLVTGPAGYMLAVGEDEVDAGVLQRLLQSVSDALATPTADGALRAVADAEEAARLWRGEPFSESSRFSWATGDIQRLKDAYLLIQEGRLEALLRLGKHREVLLEAKSLVTAYPLREQLHGLLSLALYRSGRQGEALEVHRQLRRLLAEELGIDPAPPLQTMEQQLLHQDPSLDWRPLAGGVALQLPEPGPVEGPPAVVPRPLPPPGYPTPLRGRSAELRQVAALMESARLVTVVGSPGVGKSRLAAELSGSSAAQHRWFVDLSDVGDAAFVAETLSSKLLVEGPFPKDPVDRLATALDVSGELVLDGCEALVDEVGSLVSDLLGRTRELRVLVTSRRPLQLPGEVVYRLEPLAVPGAPDGLPTDQAPAVQLFLDRASVATGHSWDDPEDLRLIEHVVRALDGLPLAIELAAANTDVIGLQALSDRLLGQLDYLVQPSSTAPARHQSLRAAIRDSIELLSEDERAFFVQLAVFPGLFDLEGAAAISQRPVAEAYPLVASLVRQSLVVNEGASRFRCLAPVRDLAAELLGDQPASDEVRRRHAQHVARVVAPLGSETHRRSQSEALTQLRRHLSDARAALQWALDHREARIAAEIASGYAWFWTLAGMSDEGMERLLQVRALVEEDDEEWSSSRTYAEMLRNLGLLANPAGRMDLAEEACERAAELSTRLDDWDGAARALLTLGIARWARGDYEGAARAHDDAAALHDRGASDWSHLAALVLRSRTALDAGDDDVELRIDAATSAARQLGDKHMGGLATLIQARWAYVSGRPRLADLSARQALADWQSIDYREGEVGALNLLGRVALHADGPEEAEPTFREALRIAAAAGHPGAQCESVESLAMVAAARARFEQAYLLYCVASLERRRIGAAVPAADLATLLALEERCTEVLGSAAELVRARARLMDFEDVRQDLLRQ